MLLKLRTSFSMYSVLPREIWILSGAILINRMGSFVFPFLTLYLTERKHISVEHTGLLLSLLPLALIPAILCGGWLADRWPRREVLAGSQALSGLFYMLAAVSPLGAQVPALTVIALFFSCIGQVAQNALLNDLAPPQIRSAAFSLNYLGCNLGFAIGPLIGGLLFTSSLTLFFLLDGVTTWVAAALVLRYIPKVNKSVREPGEIAPHAGEKIEHGSVLKALAQRPYFVAFLGLSFIVNAAYYQQSFSLPIALSRNFGADGAVFYGLLMSANAVTVALGSSLLTIWTSKWSSLHVMATAAFLYMIGFGMIGWIDTFPGALLGWLVLSTVIWSVGEILNSVSSHVYSASHTPANHRGRFGSVRMITLQLASSGSIIFAGWMLTYGGMKTLMSVIAVFSFLAGCGCLFMRRMEEGGRRSADVSAMSEWKAH